MKKLLPVLSIIVAALSSALSAVALSLTVTMTNPDMPGGLALLAMSMPVIVAATVTVGLSFILDFVFFKDRLVKFALILTSASAILIIAAYIVMAVY